MLTPLPFQEIGISFLCRHKEALLADDMGLGKTLQLIEAAKRLELTTGVVICPISVRRSWYRWFRDQYPSAFVKEITSVKSVIDFNSFNIVNYDIVWKEGIARQIREKPDWQLLICDESHFLKNTTAKRTKAILSHVGLHHKFERKWAATGTPVLNRPIELFPILRAFVPELLMQYKDYYKFAYKFCAGYNGPFGFDANGASNLDKLATLISPFMIRRLKEDVLKELPEITYEKVYLDPTDALLRLCSEEEQAKTTELPSLRHSIGVLKVLPAIAHIKLLLEEREKVVVFAWHTDVIQKIKEAFNEEAVIYTGAESVSEKIQAIDSFRLDKKVHLFIGQLKAAGTGIDGLQEACDTCLFVETSYTPGEILQAVDRIRRIGQTRPVLAQFLVVEDSMDEKIIDTLSKKGTHIKTILKEEGDGFVKSKCDSCGKSEDLSKLTRMDHKSVCVSCKQILKILEDL